MTRHLIWAVLAGLVVLLLGVSTVVVWTGDRSPDASPPPDLDGAALSRTKGCVGCHTGPGAPSLYDTGPNLRQLSTVAAGRRRGVPAEDYARESIVAPAAFIVPNFGTFPMPALALTSDEVEALVAYLMAPG